MKAAVWHGRQDIRVEDFSDPPFPSDGQIKIKVDWCGICGTDVEEYLYGPLYIPVERPNELTGRQAPLVIGHEFTGTVVEVGPNVIGLKEGDRVAPDTLLFCGQCWYCKRHLVHQCQKLAILGLMTDGGCAQYVNAPAYMCFKLPPHVPSETGALAEPAAVAIRAVRTAGVKLGDAVVITGLHNERIGMNLFPVVCSEIVIKGSFSHIYDLDFSEAVALLGVGKIVADTLITARIGIDDVVEKGLRELLQNKAKHLKILISPQR